MRGRLSHILLLLLAWLSPASATAQQPLVADLSSHLIAVTTGFVGQDLLLFGATDGEDDADVIVVVRGPNAPIVVRRKDRVGGIWVNQDEVGIEGLPTYYFVAANRDLADIASQTVLARHQIGLNHLRYTQSGGAHAEFADFGKAALRNRQRSGLYADSVRKVAFLGNRLFRTDVHFPSNVPTGSYTVTVYLIRNGAVESAQTTPLVVSKIGVGARVYDFAYAQSALYGILAILLALFAGWLASVAFRRA